MKRRYFLSAAASLLALACHRPARARRPLLRIGIASDGHYGQPGTPSDENHQALRQWFEAEKKQKGLDFVVINGDLIHDDVTFLPAVQQHLARMPVPVYTTRGNHDGAISPQLWRQTWGHDLNHFFGKNDFGFVLLDTTSEKGEYRCPDAAFVRQAFSALKNKKAVFVFMHITPAAWTQHGKDCPDTRRLFAETPNLAAIFHGHDHQEDAQKTENGKPFFWDGHFGGNWGVPYHGYRLLEIYEDGSWKTLQVNGEKGLVINQFQQKI